MSASLWDGDAAGGRGRAHPPLGATFLHGLEPEISPALLLGGEIGLHSRRKGTVASAKKAPFFSGRGGVGGWGVIRL